MVDCGDCWMDDTFNGCHLTSDECLLATGFQEDSNTIVAKNKLLEWDNIHMRDPHAAPSILGDMFKILLEAEG